MTSRAGNDPVSCSRVRGPRTGAVTPGRDSSQARASAVGVTSSSAASASYASRLVRCWAIRCSRALWELTLKCPEFPKWWSQHKVLDRTWGHKRFRHPVVGPLEIDYEALHLPGDPDQTLLCTGPLMATPAPLKHSDSSPAGTPRAQPTEPRPLSGRIDPPQPESHAAGSPCRLALSGTGRGESC